MRHRFGDSEQTIMARTLRKQRDDDPVQSYTYDMNMLFAQSVFPEAMKREIMLDKYLLPISSIEHCSCCST